VSAAAAAAGPKALDLASLRRRHVVSATPHLTNESLLLHLAPELSQRLLELLRILDDDLQTVITPLSVVFISCRPASLEPGEERLAYPRADCSAGGSLFGLRYSCSAAMAEAPRIRTKHGELSLEDVAAVLPGTGEVMRSVSHCFAMSWHASRGGNWDLALYYLRRTRSMLRGLAVTRPKYRGQLSEFETDFLEPLYQVLLERDLPLSEELFASAGDQANLYHVDTGHAYIRWDLPERPPEPGLDLSPAPTGR
jgi:hypothetical protein